MKKILRVWILMMLVFPVANLCAEQKPLKQEEVLRLRNYELTIRNMQLQTEILEREIQTSEIERDKFIETLYKRYGLDPQWKIDLQQGVWFNEKTSQGDMGQASKKSD